MTTRRRRRGFNAAQVVVFGFLGGNVIGTLLLLLPVSSAKPGTTDLLTASFTSVSALSLTGLTVVDTATHWSTFGQVIILVLIKVGGFGIMALGSLLGLVLTQRVSLKTKLSSGAEQQALGLDDFSHVLTLLFYTSAAIELSLTAVLTSTFMWGYGESFPEALWHGFFHSISAFNNAGFSTFPGSLTRFATDPVVLLPIASAAILGGLGFPVLIEITRRALRRLRIVTRRTVGLAPRLSLTTKIVLIFSAVLLAGGALYIGFAEWQNPNTIGDMTVGSKILNSFFASTMARNNGFNAVDYAHMTRETLVGTDVLMFIGGGSAGTSGGLRITTFAVLIFIVIAEIRGDNRVNTGSRRLGVSVQRTAVALTVMSLAGVVAAVIFMQVITGYSTDQIVFEVISAFGTCGLSTGITPTLPVAAKIMLMVMMFTGRIGLVLVATALARRARPMTYTLPKERPLIG